MRRRINPLYWLVNGLAGVCCILIPFLAISITYEVLLRYFANGSTLWVVDVTGYVLLTITFLGGAFVLREEGHTRVDLLVTCFGPALRALMSVVASALASAVCLVLTLASAYAVWDNYQRGVVVFRTIEVPKYLVISPIFLGSLAAFLQSLGNVVCRVRGLKRQQESKAPYRAT